MYHEICTIQKKILPLQRKLARKSVDLLQKLARKNVDLL